MKIEKKEEEWRSYKKYMEEYKEREDRFYRKRGKPEKLVIE